MLTEEILPGAPPGLLHLLDTGEFVLLLGAGIGMEAGFTGWKDSLLEVAAQLKPLAPNYAKLMVEDAKADRFLESAELLYLAPVTSHDRDRILRHVFDKEPNITRRLRLLTLTRCQGFVTTNFDRSLELAASEAKAPIVRFGESDQDLAAARVETRKFLVRLHGRIEVPESLVLAQRHYRTVPERDAYLGFFRELFVNRNLVFFGFSFADPVISQLIGDMTRAVRSVFRREAYALVAAAPPQLNESLRASGIVAVPYSPASAHDAAWRLLAVHREGESPVGTDRYEVEQVRSYLAAAYARAKGRRFRADQGRMLSALMMPVLSEHGSGTVVDIDEFLAAVEERLALPRHFERFHLVESLKLLEGDGIVALRGASLVVGDIPQPKELAKDADRLARGLIARARIRFDAANLESQRPLLDQLIISVMALDGLHLAHTLIRRHPLDSGRLETIINEAIRRVRIPERFVALTATTLIDLIVSPDAEEEQILGNIAAVVFGTALLLADPLQMDRVGNPFLKGAYVDASVLLPWLADGHPLSLAYASVLQSFKPGSVRVLSGYLNEIVNHRRLAREHCERGGFEDARKFKRYVNLFELHNINVYLGGYAGSLQHGGTETFDEYLQRVAPFKCETEVQRILEDRGLVVEDHVLQDYGLAGELKAALRERGKVRDDIVVAHDAAQMEVLRDVKDPENRAYFITADRALVRSVGETSSRHVLPNVLLPQQVGFLARMASRNAAGLEAFSRTLWTVGENVADKVRRYYTNRVLREYEEGLVAEVDTILDALVGDLRNEGVSISEEDLRDPRSETARIEIFERLDRFEPRFFQYLEEARERVRRREGT